MHPFRLPLVWYALCLTSATLGLATEQPRVNGTVKVCYAYFAGVSDLGFTYSINLGRAWVDAQLGTTSQYEEMVGLSSRERQEEVMDNFISDGCAVIVTGSDTLQPLATEYAVNYPHLRFICLTCRFPGNSFQPENLASVDILIHEASYIAGVVAALQENVKKIGYVGSVYFPASFKHINAFILGAQSVNPDIEMILMHVGSWADVRTERIAGKRMIEQYDVGLIAYDSDTSELVRVAAESGILSIAVKVDGTATFGESNLMSRIFKWNNPLLSTARAAVNLSNWTYNRVAHAGAGFDDDAISLGTFSTALSTTARIRAEQIQERFELEGDISFCLPDGHNGLAAFCPEDANTPSPGLGGIIPTDWNPCSFPGNATEGVVYPENGNCLSDDQVAAMSYVLEGYVNLGRVSVPAVCPEGTRMDYSGDELCKPCDPGYVSLLVDQEECEACEAGRFGVESGTECRQCRAGNYSSVAGVSACSQCAPGSFTSADEQTQCQLCQTGTFTNTTGATECERCAAGRYSNATGATVCFQCGPGETTEFGAARSASDCVCQPGNYRVADGSCAACPTGMACPTGSDIQNMPAQRAMNALPPCDNCPFPYTIPGYMSLARDPLTVYRCLDHGDCPGASPGAVSACGPFREEEEVACGLCKEGSFRNRSGDCEECQGGVEILTLIIVVVVCVVLTFALAIGVNRDLLLQQTGTANLVIIGGVFLTALQTTIVFNQLSMEWVDPMKSAMEITSIVSFDMGNLKLGCFVAVDPVSAFLTRQIVAPSCLPVLLASVCFKKWTTPGHVNVPVEFGNAIGTIFSAFFISVVTTSVDALVCYEHPNARSSVIIEPAVLCWAGDERHSSMVSIAVLAFILVPASFFSVCCFAVFMHPRVMARNDDRQRRFHHSFRFLFFRFRPNAYTYGLLLLIRNLIICLIPAIVSGKVGVQVLLLCGIILAFGMFQATWQPWRTRLVNRVDSVTSTVLILILMCGIMKTDLAVSDMDIAILSSSVLVIAGVTLGVGAGLSIKDSLWPNARYHHFLCHHKAFAAAQARYIQMLILKHLHRTCFLDSDDLKDLSKLFETVRTRVTHFLVYLTKETLTRPWCVGEVVVCKESKLTITKIVHWSFQGPTARDLEDLSNYVAPGVNLMEYDIDDHRIVRALHWVSGPDVPMIHMKPEMPGTSIFFNAIMDLATRKSKPTKSSLPSECDTMLISTDITDLEATAAGGILIERIQQEAAGMLQGSIILLADLGHTGLSKDELRASISRSRLTVVILTACTLECLQQVEVIIVGMLGKACLVPVVTPRFQFPGDAYFRNMLPSLFVEDIEDAERAMKNFFEQIAIPLSTHASESTLKAEASEVLRRIPADQAKRERSTVLDVRLPSARSVDYCTSYMHNESTRSSYNAAASIPYAAAGSIPASHALSHQEDYCVYPPSWFEGQMKHTRI